MDPGFLHPQDYDPRRQQQYTQVPGFNSAGSNGSNTSNGGYHTLAAPNLGPHLVSYGVQNQAYQPSQAPVPLNRNPRFAATPSISNGHYLQPSSVGVQYAQTQYQMPYQPSSNLYTTVSPQNNSQSSFSPFSTTGSLSPNMVNYSLPGNLPINIPNPSIVPTPAPSPLSTLPQYPVGHAGGGGALVAQNGHLPQPPNITTLNFTASAAPPSTYGQSYTTTASEQLPHVQNHTDLNQIPNYAGVAAETIDFTFNHPGPGDATMWPLYPDGDWKRHLSVNQYFATESCMTHWVWNSEYTRGGKNTRGCMGVLRCNNDNCGGIRRPSTKPATNKDWMRPDHKDTKVCHKCKGMLNIVACTAKSFISALDNQQGYIFKHSGRHTHLRPPNTRLDPTASNNFQKVVKQNAKKTPAQLIVGASLHKDHPEAPVTNIDPSLINNGRVKYRRQKALDSEGPGFGTSIKGGDAFILSFMHFATSQTDFIRRIIIDLQKNVFMVILQSESMAKHAVKEILPNDASCGMITDVTYKFFRLPEALLYVTGTYSVELAQWVPVLFAYSLGSDIFHYRLYHRYLFQSFGRIHGLSKQVKDDDMAQVLDYSIAQGQGGIEGFIDFRLLEAGVAEDRLDNPDYTDRRAELRERAKKIIAGCGEHFARSASTVTKNGNYVPVLEEGNFRDLCVQLVSAEDIEQFDDVARNIRIQFPAVKDWLTWWLNPNVACTVFKAHMKMSPELRDSLPSTTNPVEALHFSLYSNLGSGYSVLKGVEKLKLYVQSVELKKTSLLEGHTVASIARGNV